MNSYTIETMKVCYIRTSDEPVFVLSIQQDINGNTLVTVRRPLQTEKGVVHSVDTFFVQELYTAQEKIVEEFEMQKFMLGERDKATKERQEANSDKVTPAPKESFLN